MEDKDLKLITWFFGQRTLTQQDLAAIVQIRKFWCEKKKLNSLHYKTMRAIASKRGFPVWSAGDWDFSLLEPEVKEVIVNVVSDQEVKEKPTATRKKATKKTETNTEEDF